MARDVLKNCKKFFIQRIINPGEYWMAEYANGMCYKKQLKELEYSLARNVEQVEENDDVSVGMMVAVKDRTDFHRGIVTDVFNRQAKTTYWIVLIDYNKTVETSAKNVYFISDKLSRDQFNIFEVKLYGIQPLVLDVDYEKNFESGVFQKRVCNTWSSTSFEFVKDLLNKNPYVYVKPLCGSQQKIYGEIFLIQGSDKGPVSLGQLLHEKGFAKLSNTEIKLPDDLQGRNNSAIEGKIPKNALFDGVQESQTAASFPPGCENISESVHRVPKSQSRSFNFHSNQSEVSSGNGKSCNTSSKSSENCYSPSWMLRKCQQSYALTPLRDS